MTNRNLLIVFVLLLLIFGLTRLFKNDKTETFNPIVVQVDTSAVDEIELYPKAEGGERVTLAGTNGNWTVSKGGVTETTPASKVTPLLASMVEVKAKRIVAKSAEQWAEYEVTPETGTRVKAMAGDRILADFYIGAFKFDQVKQSASSYIRPVDEDNVYVVDGFLGMQFNRGFDALRDNRVLALETDEVNGIRMNSGTSASGEVVKQPDGQWYFAGMELVDSAAVASYLTQLRNVTSSDFADGLNPSAVPLVQVEYTISGQAEPVTVSCYPADQAGYDFAITSSSNPGKAFTSDSTGIYQRIFGNLESLLGDL